MDVTIASAGLQAQISMMGAELVRLQDKQGRDFLWDGDPAYWTGRSPLLFPVVGRVSNDTIRVDEREYNLPRHGFARVSHFAIVESEASRCLLRLSFNETTLKQFPYPFQLEVEYGIEATTLSITASVLNNGSAAMPVSFGFHPAFRWPLPFGASRDAHFIRFEHEELAPIRRPVNGLISQVPETSPVHGRTLELCDELFAKDALVFDSLQSRSVIYSAPNSGSIRVDFPDLPHLGVWTKPGSGFICIEPWQGFADPEGFQGDLTAKPGIVLIEPGSKRDFAMTITVSEAAP